MTSWRQDMIKLAMALNLISHRQFKVPPEKMFSAKLSQIKTLALKQNLQSEFLSQLRKLLVDSV